jgi:hypothetical protein
MGEKMKGAATEPRRPWTPPTVAPIGTVAEVLRGGTGKVSVITGDPGESQKVPSMEGGG